MMGINESTKSYINSEMDEIERAVQDLSRDEDIDISVKEVKEKFKNAEPKKLTKSIWSKLENTESNEIDKGDIKSVEKIAKKYNKTNPNKLKKISDKSIQLSRPYAAMEVARHIYRLVSAATILSSH
jgi:hypothetical protein